MALWKVCGMRTCVCMGCTCEQMAVRLQPRVRRLVLIALYIVLFDARSQSNPELPSMLAVSQLALAPVSVSLGWSFQ